MRCDRMRCDRMRWDSTRTLLRTMNAYIRVKPWHAERTRDCILSHILRHYCRTIGTKSQPLSSEEADCVSRERNFPSPSFVLPLTYLPTISPTIVQDSPVVIDADLFTIFGTTACHASSRRKTKRKAKPRAGQRQTAIL